jgi:hypothetical protein
VPDGEPTFADVKTRSRAAILGDRIVLEVDELAAFVAEAKCRNKAMMVLLEGQPVKGLALYGPPDATSKLLAFRLTRTGEARAVWTTILGGPTFTPRNVAVTVGLEGEVPLPATAGKAILELNLLQGWWTLLALAGFVLLLAAFWWLAKHTNILRDGTPPQNAVAVVDGRFSPLTSVANNATYSLSKMQGAWWFFIILGTYLLIGIVTWDFFSSVSSTAVILLGVGAGTVLGSAAIDASKNTAEQNEVEATKAAELKVRIDQLNDALEYASLEAKRLNAPLDATTLSDAEQTRLKALTASYGANMPKWLREAIGRPFIEIADRFELATLAAAAARPPGGSAQAARLAELEARYPQANSADLPGLVPTAANIAAERQVAISRYRKLTSQSEWWFVDILSDANGVSFHRFQLFGWTVVLGFVFTIAAYLQLAMPVFDTTLMGLLGLSAGTYLGLKIPEPTVPRS